METQLYAIFLPSYVRKRDELLGKLRSRLDDYDILGMDFHAPLSADYDQVFAQTLREMGLDVRHASLIELNEVEKYPMLVVDCWAEWRGPCRMVAPVIEGLARDYEGRIVFGKLDVDHNRKVAERYRIMSIPTLLIFRGGELVGTKVGALPRRALEAELLQHVE
jgi:thioredoxin 1